MVTPGYLVVNNDHLVTSGYLVGGTTFFARKGG